MINDFQKKQLEKIYGRIFENHNLTEEGRNLCSEANVKSEDLKIKTFDDFKNEIQFEEVAKIRFNHYQ